MTIKLTLTQQAYINQNDEYGTHYRANAKDKDDNNYTVTWEEYEIA